MLMQMETLLIRTKLFVVAQLYSTLLKLELVHVLGILQ
ncbi:Uncharacterised protein [Mycobacteroides abscessus subsp. abscessus]|nr:Uncharacterised protein [Mycobacteroides abscessus subsp. abscessus]